jgi:hypothetical protein
MERNQFIDSKQLGFGDEREAIILEWYGHDSQALDTHRSKSPPRNFKAAVVVDDPAAYYPPGISTVETAAANQWLRVAL